ncbi:MAG: hypothetical protein M3R65_04390 [Gemmatimonadota bacterium]|nr:hypothetical protein [Gemmatimonadota bacterium]
MRLQLDHARALPTSGRLAAALMIMACGGGGGSDGSSLTPTGPGATGSLNVVVAGLPGNRVPSITVAGPNSYSSTLAAAGTLSGLAPGSYTITPGPVADVGLTYVTAPVTATVTANATASASVSYALAVLPRATANRTDESALPKYHVMYVLPSDGIDRSLDTDGTLARSISSWERWYTTQTGGKYLRLDTSNGAVDITFARIPRSDATMTSYGDFLRDTLEKDLRAAGYTSTPNTLYLVYYDGGHATRCASAAWPPALPGVVAGIYLKGLASSSVPCATNPFAATPSASPGYIEFVAAHEVLHLQGIVSPGAPNFSNQHVGNDPTDLMYAGSQVWRPATLDVTKTNYYNAGGLPAGIVNLATSAYLAGP